MLLPGCRDTTRHDLLLTSVANATHTLRATIIQRQYFIEGRADTGPTTYVLLDEDQGKPEYENGQEFKPSQIVIEAAQCGPLSVSWDSERALRIRCEKCGLALSALGSHPSVMGLNNGSVRVVYDGFPEMSSWETAPRAK